MRRYSSVFPEEKRGAEHDGCDNGRADDEQGRHNPECVTHDWLDFHLGLSVHAWMTGICTAHDRIGVGARAVFG
jgi:hypothetical protein